MMGHTQEIERSRPNVSEKFEASKLPDLDLYRLDVDSIAPSKLDVQFDWQPRLTQIQAIYPQFSIQTILLGLLVAYCGRVCEDNEIRIPVVKADCSENELLSAGLSVNFAGSENFGALLYSVTLLQMHLAMADRNEDTVHPVHHNILFRIGENAKSVVSADIELAIIDDEKVCWTFASDIHQDHVERTNARILKLADGIIENSEAPLARQPLLPAAEWETTIESWNETETRYGFDGGLVAMFERCAIESPDQPAMIFKDEEVTFAEFNRRVNKLANHLRRRGVGNDCFVCLHMERSFELVVALWAVLKAGGAYVPLNTEDPDHRIEEILADCKPIVILAQENIKRDFGTNGEKVVLLPQGGLIDSDDCEHNPNVDISPNSLAYMIYTSGSTGKPKGVIVEHEAIHNRVVWMHEEYGLDANDRILQKTPYTFDVSVWEFLWSFSVGSTLVIAEPGGHMAMGYLSKLIMDQSVTHLHFVPSVLRLFLMVPNLRDLPIKKLFCSGEALGFDSVRQFYEKSNKYAEVHNLYGPTEAAVDVSYFHCLREPENEIIPIGKPVANTGLYILDKLDQPVPIGVPGELHIGGVQLARGYWAREELTKEKFIESPLSDPKHPRLYRTGDLAYHLPNGDIVYLGRNDFQVKINGVRMELGEIEAAIRDVEGVKDVVVMAEEANGSKALVAYVVAANPSTGYATCIQNAVASTRPAFYVPKEIRFVEQMPLTVSGKIDRKQLASMATI